MPINDAQHEARYFARPIGECISATFLAEGALLSDYQHGTQVSPNANTQIVFNLENLFSQAGLNLTTPNLPTGLPPNGAQCQNPPVSSGGSGGIGVGGGNPGGSGEGAGGFGGFGGGSSGGAGASGEN